MKSPLGSVVFLSLVLVAIGAGCATESSTDRLQTISGLATYRAPQLEPSIPAPVIDENRMQRPKQRQSVMIALATGAPHGAQATPAEIGRAQKELLNGLRGSGVIVKHLFRHIPYATLQVNTDALTKLKALDVVASVSEEAVYYPMLMDSHTADASWSFGRNTTGAGVAVAIIDDGITPHSFYADRLVEEYCTSTPTGDEVALCDSAGGMGTDCKEPGFRYHGT